MEYNFREIEKKWQKRWKDTDAYQVSNVSDKPKYYVLDMFPYPSGAGLHVGHPLGYIASDIFARFKRLKGFNVLHPMGYDAFGLPAEQYAIEHGVHPAISTEKNIDNFRRQLDNIGFCFDWDREVRTSDPKYYKWTQWIFLQLFNSYFNRHTNKAEPIAELVKVFEQEGNANYPCPGDATIVFENDLWKSFTDEYQQEVLMNYRLAYCGFGEVNWCEALGTVLANDEVVNGVSERGGHPVVKKKLRQWYLRITEYADRLLEGLQRVDFSDAMKEMQTNWIGRSTGAEIIFRVKSTSGVMTRDTQLTVYTTRPDTIFGVDFMVVAPEHELVKNITSPEQKQAVEEYIAYVKSRSERERMAEKKISGCFTGAFAINPFNGKEIPIWISEYVLAGYGTGAIMAVPCGDERDFKFAKYFNIPVTNIIGDAFNGEDANATKDAILVNSDFLNGMVMRDAMELVADQLQTLGIGKRKVNYRMRDAAFSRQRYWGEPFPIVWKDGTAFPLDEKDLPLNLPLVYDYEPGEKGEGPLSNVKSWTNFPSFITKDNFVREANTMPGYAGSSWYFLRYMDPHNDNTFCDRKVSDYWNQVDLYIGGTEHAVGHLLYSRMWTKALYDLGHIGFDEPYRKLVNQGMIQGSSRFVNRINSLGIEELLSNYLKTFSEYNFIKDNTRMLWKFLDSNKKVAIDVCPERFSLERYEKAEYSNDFLHEKYKLIFISNEEILWKITQNQGKIETWLKEILASPANYKSQKNDPITVYISHLKTSELELDDLCIDKLHVDVNIVDGVNLNIDDLKRWKPEFEDAVLINEDDGLFICDTEIEKMSKSKFNSINPDDLVIKYGADTFRMYEMFLGPVEQSKPWDTKGIEGVHRFIKKLWRLFFDEIKGKVWNEEKATAAELKVLHKTIKKIEDDTERFSFNTAVSAFMVCVNELSDLKCNKREILEPLLIMLVPYAPHVTEELWAALGNTTSILDASFPVFEAKYTAESSKEYPVSINGKLRTTINLSLDITQQEVEPIVLANETLQKWLEGKQPKKIIFVKGKMINIVI